MHYTDIHSHMLCRTDDGAGSPEEMKAMLDMAYGDGIRTLCLTPHLQFAFYGDNREKAEKAFSLLSAYAAEKYPDMVLSRANELGYSVGCERLVEEGVCRLVGGKFVLLDFPMEVPLFTLKNAVDVFHSEGFPLILAHIERYPALLGEYDLLAEWKRKGVLLQVDADFFEKPLSFHLRGYRKQLLHRSLVHAVASDAHDTVCRPPQLSGAARFLTRHFGADTADYLLSYAPGRMTEGKRP